LEQPAQTQNLIVGDNVDSAEALGELLSLWGHELEMAHHGLTALELIQRRAPEVVLLDIGLPEVNGYWA